MQRFTLIGEALGEISELAVFTSFLQVYTSSHVYKNMHTTRESQIHEQSYNMEVLCYKLTENPESI